MSCKICGAEAINMWSGEDTDICDRCIQKKNEDARLKRIRKPSESIVLFHPVNHYEVQVKDGFSWWCLLFGLFWYLYKEMFFWSVISAISAFLTLGVSWFVFPFFANKQYKDSLLKKGYLTREQLESISKPEFLPVDVVGELERLMNLKESGGLTDEEFLMMKKKIISD